MLRLIPGMDIGGNCETLAWNFWGWTMRVRGSSVSALIKTSVRVSALVGVTLLDGLMAESAGLRGMLPSLWVCGFLSDACDGVLPCCLC